MVTADQLAALYMYFPPLRTVSPAMRMRLESEAVPLTAPAGSQVRPLGAICDSLPMLTSGTIRVVRYNDAGRSLMLYRVRPGEVCSMSVTGTLAATAFTATAIAEQPIAGACIPHDLLVDLMSDSVEMRRFLFAGVCERQDRLLELIDDLAFSKVEQRLAKRLLATQPRVLATHQALADELGSAREVISRTLKVFETRGYLRLRRGEIVVTDGQALATLTARTAL